MKLTTMTQVTVDGVMQGPGGPDEDRRGGFERGGWALPLFDNETMTFINQTFQRGASPLLCAPVAGKELVGPPAEQERVAPLEGPGNHQIAAALNTKPKYVASNTLTEPR